MYEVWTDYDYEGWHMTYASDDRDACIQHIEAVLELGNHDRGDFALRIVDDWEKR